jgi:hypothetical protein
MLEGEVQASPSFLKNPQRQETTTWKMAGSGTIIEVIFASLVIGLRNVVIKKGSISCAVWV